MANLWSLLQDGESGSDDDDEDEDSDEDEETPKKVGLMHHHLIWYCQLLRLLEQVV